MDIRLPLLVRHYAALSPTSPFLLPSSSFPPPASLSRPATQQWLVDHLLAHSESGGEEDDGARAWRRGFWKRAVKDIEKGFEQRRKDGDEEVEDEEVHPDILEVLVDLLSSARGAGDSAPGVSTRTYYWGDLHEEPRRWKSVMTREEGRMISGGTTGLRTWQACIALSNHLLASPSRLSPVHNILELGAGVGLLSLVTAKLLHSEAGGGEERRRVVATDVNDRVLEMLQDNIELNGLSSLASATSLDWELASDPSAGHARLAEWEAATFGAGKRPDLILGADIVYDPALAGHLGAMLAWLLRPTPDAESAQPQALIAGTIRNESTWALFLSECRNRQLTIEPVDLLQPEGKSGIVGAEGWEGEGEVRLVRISAA
ncbi:hypothetical protein JCM8097_005535 [Rhodosporidiobolus ruineniae]